MWKWSIDPEFCFWTYTTVRNLIRNEAYIGKVVSNRYKMPAYGARDTLPTSKEEWISVPNMHEPLVSEADFNKAQLILQRITYSDKPKNIFKGKIRCPFCGHAMLRYTAKNPRYRCATVDVSKH